MIFPDTEIYTADANSTHAVDILAFVEAQEILFLYFETPYYLAPAPGGEKVYALLRETLRRTKKIGIARVVIQAHQHLAALIPQGDSLVLNTLRWASEDDTAGRLYSLVEEGMVAGLTEDELAMAAQLIESMTGTWELSSHQDAFREDFTAFAGKRSTGKTAQVAVEELNDFLGDDTFEDDDYVVYLMHSKAHARHGNPVRRVRTAHQHRQGCRRRR